MQSGGMSHPREWVWPIWKRFCPYWLLALMEEVTALLAIGTASPLDSLLQA
jgi:hypothetical protein